MPAYLPGAGADDGRARDLLIVLPTALGAFLLLAVVSAASSGGGRELLARDPGSVHPIAGRSIVVLSTPPSNGRG